MKKLLLFALLCQVAQAALAPTPTASQPAAAIPSTPLIALDKAKAPAWSNLLKPRGAKMLRCVMAPAGEGGKGVWLFFYGSRPSSRAKRPFNISEQSLSVDLKIVERKKQGKKWGWKILRTVPLGICEEYMWQECKLLWMNPSAKTGPIVLVPRIEGDELIAFPDGWNQKKAVHQSFGRMASSLAAISYQFDAVDEKGIFMVTEERSERSEDGGDNSYVFLKWNGKEWKLKE